MVVWVGSLRRWQRQRSGTTAARQSNSEVTLRDVQMCCETTHSATCIRIRIQVAECVVPQHVRTPSNELQNHPFRNMYTDPYTYSEMGSFATYWEVSECVAEPPIPQLVYGSVYTLRNGWFRNKNSSKIRNLPKYTINLTIDDIYLK